MSFVCFVLLTLFVTSILPFSISPFYPCLPLFIFQSATLPSEAIDTSLSGSPMLVVECSRSTQPTCDEQWKWQYLQYKPDSCRPTSPLCLSTRKRQGNRQKKKKQTKKQNKRQKRNLDRLGMFRTLSIICKREVMTDNLMGSAKCGHLPNGGDMAPRSVVR